MRGRRPSGLPPEFLAGLRRPLRRFFELAAGALARLSRLIYRSERERESDRRLRRERQWYADRGDETLRLDYDLEPDSLVLDAGGYLGHWSADIFCKFSCRIEVYEPVESFAAATATRFERNPRIAVHHYGLGGENRRDSILLDEVGSSSVLTPVGVDAARAEIELRDVVEVIDELDRDEIDLLKINIEGGEFELLERLLAAGQADRFRYLQIQFHSGAPAAESRRGAIRDDLARTHRLMWDYPWIWESWERRS
jgi:FkbM family methyltransferase